MKKNLNDRVKVQLTKRGRTLYDAYMNVLHSEAGVTYTSTIREDLILITQLHELMRVFGQYLHSFSSPQLDVFADFNFEFV